MLSDCSLVTFCFRNRTTCKLLYVTEMGLMELISSTVNSMCALVLCSKVVLFKNY